VTCSTQLCRLNLVERTSRLSQDGKETDKTCRANRQCTKPVRLHRHRRQPARYRGRHCSLAYPRVSHGLVHGADEADSGEKFVAKRGVTDEAEMPAATIAAMREVRMNTLPGCNSATLACCACWKRHDRQIFRNGSPSSLLITVRWPMRWSSCPYAIGAAGWPAVCGG
jgi:hypothetical protein